MFLHQRVREPAVAGSGCVQYLLMTDALRGERLHEEHIHQQGSSDDERMPITESDTERLDAGNSGKLIHQFVRPPESGQRLLACGHLLKQGE